MSQIDYNTLLAYAAGELSTDAAAEVEAHLATTPDAAATVARYQALRQSVQAGEQIAPPPDIVTQAKALFRGRTAPAPAPKTSWWQRLEEAIATLVFDSRPEPALAGLRGSTTGFQLAFERDTSTVDLQAELEAGSEPSSWRLTGQVDFGDADRSGDVAVVPIGSNAAMAQTTADRQGMFNVQLPPGQYDLHIRSSRGSIVCQNIELN